MSAWAGHTWAMHPQHSHPLCKNSVGKARKILNIANLAREHQCAVCQEQRLVTYYSCAMCNWDACAECVSKAKAYVNPERAASVGQHGDDPAWQPLPYFKPFEHTAGYAGPSVRCRRGHLLRDAGVPGGEWACSEAQSCLNQGGDLLGQRCFSCNVCNVNMCERCYRSRQERRSCPACKKAMAWSDCREDGAVPVTIGYARGWTCAAATATCGKTLVSNSPWRWFCQPCRRDYCSDCYGTLHRLVAAKCPTGHPIKDTGVTNTGWACDARTQGGGCRSGLTDFYQSSGMRQLNCSLCD